MDSKEIKDQVISWNLRFPMDRWWRKKYNIAFNSSSHRESNFLDQLFEFEEDKLYNELMNSEEYVPGNGDWIKTKEPVSINESISQLKDEFKDI